MREFFSMKPHLIVIEVAVLKVDMGGDSANACVGVVVGVLAHTIGKTLLEKEKTHKVKIKGFKVS